MSKTETRILELLADGPKYGSDLWMAKGVRGFALYPILSRLEQRGAIVGEFIEGTKPRRRLYRLAAS